MRQCVSRSILNLNVPLRIRWSSRYSLQASEVRNDSTPDGYKLGALVWAGVAGLVGGTLIGDRDIFRDSSLHHPSAKCDVSLTPDQLALAKCVEGIVGRPHVKHKVKLTGSMVGQGTALLVVSPGTLAEAVKVLRACVSADVAVLPQGANTGLTGGSVPRNTCDRPTVVISMTRLNKILPIGDGTQVLCFAGAGIFDLKEKLKKEVNRDSHSVLGSIFLNPSVAGGVSFGSGGTQLRKGPVFTERALFCRVCDGHVEIVDTLGLKEGEDVLTFLEERSTLEQSDMDLSCDRPASWPKYRQQVATLDNDVSRYNADTTGIDCNRSEGKVMILATVHDTFALPKSSKMVWVSFKDFDTANDFKRQVVLSSPDCMANSCEYIERNQFDMIDEAGRCLIKMIEIVGMKNLGTLWNMKLWMESLPVPFAGVLFDKILWWSNSLFPESLPAPMMELGRAYDHHVIVELAEIRDGELAELEKKMEDFLSARQDSAKYHVCRDAHEVLRATLFRFCVQPSLVAYAVGMGLQAVTIDYAMPKNHPTFFELPSEFPVVKRCLCAHFGCNVYHESLIFGPEVDVRAAKHSIKHAIEHSGGRLPAEHGHGTDYDAPVETKERWMRMDPTNSMNPGVGGTSSLRRYGAGG